MAVNFSSISGHPILHGCELSAISGTTYPAWLLPFQTSLRHPILNGRELFNHLWKHISCMAISFSSISGTSYPAWLRAFQPALEQPWAFEASLGHPILHGCDMAVNFSIKSGIPILHGCELFQHVWNTYPVWL